MTKQREDDRAGDDDSAGVRWHSEGTIKNKRNKMQRDDDRAGDYDSAGVR